MLQLNYWRKRWEEGRTGWHLSDVNPKLVEYWPQLNVDAGSTVFVPLCGCSLDMYWLADQGFHVFGIDVSPVAVANVVENERVNIACQDFFELEHEPFTAWYDRAALVALEPKERLLYFSKLAKLLVVGAKGLLVSFEYPKGHRVGPPFSVNREEISQLCKGHFRYTEIAREGDLEVEVVYELERI